MSRKNKAVMSASDVAVSILWRALGSYRPDGSRGISELMRALEDVAPIGSSVFIDGARNLWIDSRERGSGSVMFCAHLDAVHPKGREGKIPLFWSADGASVHTAGAAVLGADDGAGVALLAGMMAGGIPGLYLFTQGEETGAHGMRYAVAKHQDRAKGITKVVAFDRRGTGEICGAQSCGVLASRAFVGALADGLGLGHAWGTGTYTDNQEWSELGEVREIVNVSVGYDANHSKAETLDFNYWSSLLQACLSLDWEGLPVEGPAIERWERFGGSWGSTFAASSYGWDDGARGSFDAFPGSGDSVVDDEAESLTSALGFPAFGWEADLILDAIARAFRAGQSR